MERTRLYHKDEPDGKIFTDEKKYEKALKRGWVDAPHKISEGPPDLVCPIENCDYEGTSERGLETHIRMKHGET